MRRGKTEILRQVQKFPAKNFPAKLSRQKPNALGKGGGVFDADNGATRQKFRENRWGNIIWFRWHPLAFATLPRGGYALARFRFVVVVGGYSLRWRAQTIRPNCSTLVVIECFSFFGVKTYLFNHIRLCVTANFLKCRHSCDNQRRASVSNCFF